MSIADTIRSLGVGWIRVVNPYRLESTLRTIREAMTTTAGGLKVVIAKAECQLERQRRVKPQIAARLKAGGRVDSARFGVDPDVCTGDKSCMRLNGCPRSRWATVATRFAPIPLPAWIRAASAAGSAGRSRTRPCSAFVLRGGRGAERALWERALAAVRARVIGWLQAA